MDINKKISQFLEVDKLDETTMIPIVQGTPLFNAKVSPKNLAKNIATDIAEELDIVGIDGKITAVEEGLLTKADKSSVSNVDNTSDRDKPVSDATQLELDKKVDNSRVLTNVPLNAVFTDTVVDVSGKVDKVEGKSLIADSEIARLANVTNQVVPTKTSELENDSRFVNSDDLTELGGGDMLKSIYDVDNSGIVDNAKKVNGFTVETSVPSDAKFTDTIVDVEHLATKEELESKVDKEAGKSLISNEEILRLSTVTNQNTEHLASKDELSGKVDKEEGKVLIEQTELTRLAGVTNQDISNLATKGELDNFVVKEEGKSLLEDSEIERLKTLNNNGGPVPENVETIDNKKNFIDPASMTDYPTSMAVADYVAQNTGGYIDTDKLNNLPDNRTLYTDFHAGQMNHIQSSRKIVVNGVLEGNEYEINISGWNHLQVEHFTIYFNTGEVAPTFKYSGFSPIWKDSAELVLMPNMFYELLFKIVSNQYGSKTVLGEYQVYDLSTAVVVIDTAGSDHWGENLITVGQTPDAFMQYPLEESTWVSMSDGTYMEGVPITWTGWETEYDYNTLGEYVYLGHLGEEYDNREVRKVYKVVEPYITSITFIDKLSEPLYVLRGTPKESIPFPMEVDIHYSDPSLNKYNVPILDFVAVDGYPEYNPNPNPEETWSVFKPVFAEEYDFIITLSVQIVDELVIIGSETIDLDVLVGTPEEEVPFPTEVLATMSDGTEQMVPVTDPWYIQDGVYDGNAAWSSFTYNTPISFEYAISATLIVNIRPLQVVSYEPIEDIVVPYGTELGTITFPTETVATMSDETTQTLQIQWYKNEWESIPYYQSYTPGVYVFNGYFEVDEGIDLGMEIPTVNVVVEEMVSVKSYEPIALQEVPLGTTQEELILPTEMAVILTNDEQATVYIDWMESNPAYDANQANIYTFYGHSMEYMGDFQAIVKVGEPVISSVDIGVVEVILGSNPSLTSYVIAQLEQGGSAHTSVTWTHSEPEFDTNTLGEYVYHGTLSDLWGNYPVTQTVNVIEDYINNIDYGMEIPQPMYILTGTALENITFPTTANINWASGTRYEESVPIDSFTTGEHYPEYDSDVENIYNFKPVFTDYEYEESRVSGMWIQVNVIAEHKPINFQDAHLSVEVGTLKEDIPFPTTATAYMTDGSTQEFDVTDEWSAIESYDPDMPHMSYHFITYIDGVAFNCYVNVTPIQMVEHDPIADIIVPYGTPQESIPFPAEVTGRLSDGTEVTISGYSIYWGDSNPPYTPEEGTYVFNGHAEDYMYAFTVNVIVEAMTEA